MSEPIAEIDLKLDYVVSRRWQDTTIIEYLMLSRNTHTLHALWTRDRPQAERFSRGEAFALTISMGSITPWNFHAEMA